MLDQILAGQVLPGLMEPSDVTDLYLFLASDLARNITGQAVNARLRRGDGVTGRWPASRPSSPAAPAASAGHRPGAGGRGLPGRDRRPGRAWADGGGRGCRSGGRAFPVAVDVADEAQVLAMFDAALPPGRLDILVNNAGILLDKPLLDTTAEEFDRLIAVNLRGVFLVGREAIRAMSRQDGGRVINVASEPAYLGRENFAPVLLRLQGRGCR